MAAMRYGALTVTIAMLATGLAIPRLALAQAAQDEQKKFDVEVRLMFWADESGRQSLPGQDEDVKDLFIRRARAVIQARVTESIGLYVQVGQDNVGGKVLTDDGSIRIKDAYGSYRAANAFQLIAGQFKIPFLRANLESGFNQLLVDRGTLPTLRPAREGSRDLGAMAWGNLKGAQYRVAVFDGSDQDTRNASSNLRLSTRLAYNWSTNETGLGYTGSYLGSRRILQVAGQLDAQNDRVDPRDDGPFAALQRDYRTYAFEAFYEQPFAGTWAVTFEGAWFNRQDDYTLPDIATRELKGYYAQGGVMLPGQIGPGRLQVVARREDWDTSRGPAETTTTRNTGGANYYLKGHDRKVQLDYTWKGETLELRNDEFRLSLVLVF